MKNRFATGVLALCSVALLAGCAMQKPQQNLALNLNSPTIKKKISDATAVMPISVVAAASPNYRLAQLAENVPLPNYRESALNQLAYADSSAATASEAFNAVAFSGSPMDNSIVLERSTPEVEALIKKYALAYELPESLVRRVVKRESNGNPNARNGPYWGLMQISHPTARKMGYDGYPDGLLDAETNLRYAVKYLAGAYKVADKDPAKAVRYYARGYYFDAKSKNLLEETGLKTASNFPTVDSDDGIAANAPTNPVALSNTADDLSDERNKVVQTSSISAADTNKNTKNETVKKANINRNITNVDKLELTAQNRKNFIFPVTFSVLPTEKPID